jgi:uncharacterized membrane protein SpoIIM required for sporulation
MRETKFIEQNKEKWAEYERMLSSGQIDPQRLNELFIQVTDDLSYARTFYPNRSVRVYLNHLAQRVFKHIYRGKRLKSQGFVNFWVHDLPQTIWESRTPMLLSLVIFLLAMAVGVVSSIAEPEFARTILGDTYIDQTLANIENKDPMAIYKDGNPLSSSSWIALNNLTVALRTAVLGVFASIGTIISLISNGVMVGVFQYFFIERGLFWESFLTIWIHGTIEISAIIIAGGSGITAGSGLLFPGTFTRTQAFQLSVRRGMKIFLGVVPLLLIAAFFEGFLTRFTETPDVIRGLFIAASAAFVLSYFVALPWLKARRGDFDTTQAEADLPPDRLQLIQFDKVKPAGEVIADTFSVLKRHLRLLLAWAPLGAVLLMVLSHWTDHSTGTVFRSGAFLPFEHFWSLTSLYYCILMAVLAWLALRTLQTQEPDYHNAPDSIWKHALVIGLMILPAFCYGFLIDFTASWHWVLRLILVLMLIFPPLWCAILYFDTRNPLVALGYAFRYARFEQIALIGAFTLSFFLLSKGFLNSTLWTNLLELISWVVPPDTDSLSRLERVCVRFMSNYVLLLTWIFIVIAAGIQFFSGREAREAHALYDAIESVGNTPRIRGLAREATA